MIEFRHQEQDAFALSRHAHTPVHAEMVGDADKARAERKRLTGKGEGHPHEKGAAEFVLELLSLDDIAALGRHQSSDGRDDARPIWARQRQD